METPNQKYQKRTHLFFVPIIFIAISAASGIVMYLWNAIVPTILSLPTITFWQAMGLFILCRILFGGWSYQRHHKAGHHIVHDHFKDKFMKMDEDEKQKFKNLWKSKCCKSE